MDNLKQLTDQASSGVCGLHGKVGRIDPIVHCKKHPSGGMQVLSQTFGHPPELSYPWPDGGPRLGNHIQCVVLPTKDRVA